VVTQTSLQQHTMRPDAFEIVGSTMAVEGQLSGTCDEDARPPAPRHTTGHASGFQAHDASVNPQRPDRAYPGHLDAGIIVLGISDKAHLAVASHQDSPPPCSTPCGTTPASNIMRNAPAMTSESPVQATSPKPGAGYAMRQGHAPAAGEAERLAPGSNRYGPTAARDPAEPDRHWVRSLVVDIHSHVSVPEAAAYAAPHLGPTASPLARFATPDSRALNRKQEGDRRSVSTDIEPRLAELDDMGIDVQVVMAPPGQCYYTLPAEIACVATRMVNEGLAHFASRKPDRFLAFGGVALQDPASAVRELEHCSTSLGFKGVQILTNVAGRDLSAPEFEPFWSATEALGTVVLIHPNGFTQGERLTEYYSNNVVGNPFETTLALHHLIFGGVLERHPDLRILAVHGGGYLPAYSGRMDHAWGARSDAQASLPRVPSSYLRQVYVDSVVFTAHQLEHLARVVGSDHILLGTDYPFDMAEYDPLGHLAAVQSFDDATRAEIAGGNAARLLGLLP